MAAHVGIGRLEHCGLQQVVFVELLADVEDGVSRRVEAG